MDMPLPTGLLRLLNRFPILFYKLGLGFMMGKRFLILTHKGRNSGKQRNVVLEVVKYDELSGNYYIASGWGERSNWYRNILIHPLVSVKVGNKKFNAMAKKLSTDEASRIFFEYAQLHPRAFAIITNRLMGESMEPTFDVVKAFAGQIPIFSLTPVSI